MPLNIRDVSYLHECVNFEIKTGDKKYNLANHYRSPSQTKDEFENLIKNLELNLEYILNKSPFLIVVLGDFIARMQNWYQGDIATFKRSMVDMATSEISFSQIIKEPIHILSNSAS